MITIEERTWAAAPMSNARRMTPRNHGCRRFMDRLKGGSALLCNRRIPSRDKIVTLALAVGITACVIAFEIPVEALVIWAFAKAGFIGVMALDGVEALAGPIILSCLLLRSNSATASAIATQED